MLDERLIADIRKSGMKTKVVITPCGGCAMGLEPVLKSKGDRRVVMLPEVVWAALHHQPL